MRRREIAKLWEILPRPKRVLPSSREISDYQRGGACLQKERPSAFIHSPADKSAQSCAQNEPTPKAYPEVRSFSWLIRFHGRGEWTRSSQHIVRYQPLTANYKLPMRLEFRTNPSPPAIRHLRLAGAWIRRWKLRGRVRAGFRPRRFLRAYRSAQQLN